MKLINVCSDLSKDFPNYKKNLLATIEGKEECDIHQILHRFNDTLIVRCNDKLIKISIIDKKTGDNFYYIMDSVKDDGILLKYSYNFPEEKKHGFLMQEMNICSDIFRNYRFKDELEIIDGIKQIIQQLYKYYLRTLFFELYILSNWLLLFYLTTAHLHDLFYVFVQSKLFLIR